MKKELFIVFVILTTILFSESKNLEENTREYHQSMEEKVFELENKDIRSIKEDKAFILGKRRLDDLKNNEKKLLELEEKYGIDRNKEIAELEEKYSKVLDKYSKLKDERELIIFENSQYEEQLKRINELEKNF